VEGTKGSIVQAYGVSHSTWLRAACRIQTIMHAAVLLLQPVLLHAGLASCDKISNRCSILGGEWLLQWSLRSSMFQVLHEQRLSSRALQLQTAKPGAAGCRGCQHAVQHYHKHSTGNVGAVLSTSAEPGPHQTHTGAAGRRPSKPYRTPDGAGHFARKRWQVRP
jgi:hypothetical protein